MRVPQPLLLGILGMKLPENSLRVGPARILVRDFPDFPKMMGPMKFWGGFFASRNGGIWRICLGNKPFSAASG